MKQYLIDILILLFFITLLLSCSKQNNLQDLKRYVKKIDNRPAQSIPELPKMDFSKPYQVDIKLKRDPFAPFVSPTTLAKRPDVNRPREPLEKFALDALKMVGTIKEKNRLWALIQSPKGVNRVKVGQYIGKNAGHIVKITPLNITIKETIPDGQGNWEQRIIKMELTQ